MKKIMSLRINPLRNMYDDNGIPKRLRHDLNLVVLSVVFGMVFFSISGGAPLTGLAQELGANDFFYGLMLALPIVGSVVQLIASWLLEKTRKRKMLFIIFGVLQRALWIPIGFIPFIFESQSQSVHLWILISLITMASMSGSFVNVGFYSWMGDLIPKKMQGHYLGVRGAISTIVGLVGALVASFFLDAVPGIIGYGIVFAIAAVFGIMDIITFIWIKDPPMHEVAHEPFFKVAKNAIKNKSFMKFVLFWSVFGFTWNLSAPYYNMYALGSLNLSFTMLTLAGQIAGGLASAFLSSKWGKLLDLHGNRWVLYRGTIITAIIPIVWIFATQGNAWVLLIFSIINGGMFCGINLTSQRMLISSTPDKNRSLYVAIYFIFTSLFGAALGFVVGGAVLNAIGEATLNLGRLIIDRYMFVFIGAGILRLIASLIFIPGVPNKAEL